MMLELGGITKENVELGIDYDGVEYTGKKVEQIFSKSFFCERDRTVSSF